jgi:hypothetical protein
MAPRRRPAKRFALPLFLTIRTVFRNRLRLVPPRVRCRTGQTILRGVAERGAGDIRGNEEESLGGRVLPLSPCIHKERKSQGTNIIPCGVVTQGRRVSRCDAKSSRPPPDLYRCPEGEEKIHLRWPEFFLLRSPLDQERSSRSCPNLRETRP